ncbi:DUF1926 domain-containing protein [bacterium]|nr:MAG: DUF1926 domain-containing protein [bacterium]
MSATFVLVLHNHQPVGNFPFVFEQAYQRAYSPMLDAIERHGHVRLALHYSGPLLDWLEAERPAFLDRLRVLAEQGRVELLSGGYYEPILPAIPDRDKIGQIERLNTYLKRRMHVRARGAWIAERVWEPVLARPLRDAGIEYTLLDDTQFASVGIAPERSYGYFVTEEEGRALALFPMHMALRHAIPFRPVDEVLALMSEAQSAAADPVLVMGDDGEKFGNWPGTYGSVYEQGWLDRFFAAIARAPWLEMRTPAEVLDARPPLGRIYVPNGSYQEMIEWSGGLWRNFLVRYPEANQLHKKMLDVSQRVSALEGRLGERARDELWQGQCNCPYWHGVFGGIYLNSIREANFEHLIAAERIADHKEYGDHDWIHAQTRDLDCDGMQEALVATESYSAIVAPSGGAISELDLKATNTNLTDVLARRPEAYHRALRERARMRADEAAGGTRSIHDIQTVKEEGLEALLAYDDHRRGMLVDHFFDPDVTLDAVVDNRDVERGDFLEAPYELVLKRRRQAAAVALRRIGRVRGAAGTQRALEIEKTLKFAAGSTRIVIHYALRNRDTEPLRARFAVEFNLGLQAGDASDRYIHSRGRHLQPPNAGARGISREREISAVDEWRGFEWTLRCGVETEFWRYGVETVSNSEEGIERTYQGTCMLATWIVDIAPGLAWEGGLEMRLDALVHAGRRSDIETGK